ncbi:MULTISPECIES: tetratricopeptide repeat protein [unclassified Spirosoma]|uniref:tetratricopeptide repeat protein n=1 Tax=unclassified Spirosoma TaxID=2621999 RepID=UPI0009594E08|nr:MULTISPECIES: tetratricopeptide repeat protein [unclassified Spirosoma]MBN8824079.1 tetratricopeptide repeat protein [Spirosoma sp.]OJW70477.1 MAG: cytochrome C biosynthesis protein [Spirosoma sp. 48-14]
MSKKNSGLEFLEDPDALAGQLERAEDFFEQNRNIVFGVLGGILLLVVGYFGYRYYISEQDDTAQVEMFPSVYQLEADSTKKALNGDGKSPGLLAVASNYGSTSAGNLAEFYSGIALLKQGKYDDAIEHLKAFSSSDLLVQARAYALTGDAYMEKKSFDEAADYYRKAADYKSNKYFTPGYLMKLAVAYEQAKQNDKAIDTYNEIIEKYAQSAEAGSAKKYKSVLEATVGES